MYAIIDTETTDIESPRVVEFAMGIIEDVNNLDGIRLVSGIYKPPTPISIKAMSVHGITNEDVDVLPPFMGSKEYLALQEINCEENYCVIHNAKFDLGVLKNEGIDNKMKVIDTLKCNKHVFADNPNVEVNLQFLKYYLSIHKEPAPWPTPGSDSLCDPLLAHSAAGDVATLYYLFKRMVVRYGINKLVEWTTSPILYKVMPFGKHKGKLIHDIVVSDKGYATWVLNKGDDEDIKYSFKHYMAGVKK